MSDEDNYDIEELFKPGRETCILCGAKISHKLVELKTKIKRVETHFCTLVNGTCKLTHVKHRKQKCR